MELAIPIIAAGWLYVISKQQPAVLPVVERFTPLIVKEAPAAAQKKPPPSSADYFTDLAGRNVRRDELTSQNTVPFFGRHKSVGAEIRPGGQGDQRLDSMSGGGSMQMNKTEVAPLFNPNENLQYPLGAPNNSDFYQSRVNASTSFNNVKPFQDIKVGPGLDQGYGGGGSSGYNSGMDARDKWLPPTVDELRAANKPKVTFEGRQGGPAVSAVQNRGFEGKVEKHLPDRYYVNTPERYFTTTGAESAPTYRSEQMTPEVSRVHTAYVGAAGNSGVEQPTEKGLVRLDHRQQFKTPLALAPATAAVPRSNVAAERQSMAVYDNNRTSTAPERAGNIQALISAIAAPLTDLLRPTRKEDTIIAKRMGMPAPPVQALPLLPTTTNLKDPTLYSPLEMGARPHQASTNGAYTVSQQQAQLPMRVHSEYSGIPTSAMPKAASYEAGYNAVIQTNRANEGRIAGAGNSNVFLGQINQTAKPREHFASMGAGPTSMYSATPTAQMSETRALQEYAPVERNEASILDAFRANPYTHSLQSAVAM